MSTLDEATINSIITKTAVPVVFRGFVSNWPHSQWTLEKWTEIFGQRKYPFRCVNKYVQSKEPCWERRCTIKYMTFKNFTETVNCSDEAMYFDYKYLHEWFSENDQMCEDICWKQFGFLNKGPRDTTLWVGSNGAHTPAHQDTYGVNIVTQVHGKKRWILFPPGTLGLKPTRVPYEESSVYSELNFYFPTDIQVFKGLRGARVVELSAGDALLVPHRWWHYVQNEEPVNISLNMWLPHEEDNAARVSEAAIKLFVAQTCKDLSSEQVKQVVNPTEDDLTDTSLADLLCQLKAATDQCLDTEHKSHRTKRQRTGDYVPTDTDTEIKYDLEALVQNPGNNLEILPTVTGEELARIVEKTKNQFEKAMVQVQVEDVAPALSMVKPVINAFCQPNVLDQFRQNLLSNLSQ